jgi:molybdopterin-synthase adenylyltransferase
MLSPQEVRWDLSNERQRAADPYFSGRANITQPAVISLNSTVASHAVTMFLAAVAGIPTDVRSQLVRGIPGITRALATAPREGCITCSKDAYYGKGALHELPCRAA